MREQAFHFAERERAIKKNVSALIKKNKRICERDIIAFRVRDVKTELHTRVVSRESELNAIEVHGEGYITFARARACNSFIRFHSRSIVPYRLRYQFELSLLQMEETRYLRLDARRLIARE